MSRGLLNFLTIASLVAAAACMFGWTQSWARPLPCGTVALLLLLFPGARAALALRAHADLLHRIDYGLCRGCGYCLRGCERRCPECGRPFRPHERVALRQDAAHPRGRNPYN